MEKQDQDRVRTVVEEILAVVDMDTTSEKKVREIAAEKTGIDLSSRECRKFVSNVIKKFIESGDGGSDAEADASKPLPKEEKPKAQEDSNNRSSKKMKEMKVTIENEDANDQHDEGEEEEERGEGKKPKYEMDEEGNTIICELSAKRKVVVSQWRGKALVSVREYYEKDGKVLPTSKGISLTAEQFEVLAKSAKDIEAAISSLQ